MGKARGKEGALKRRSYFDHLRLRAVQSCLGRFLVVPSGASISKLQAHFSP